MRKRKEGSFGCSQRTTKIQEFEDKPIKIEALLANLFIQTKGLNGGMPLGMTKRSTTTKMWVQFTSLRSLKLVNSLFPH
jgi:hypothetical protein